MRSLEHRSVLLTGAAGGIGGALAHALSAQGARLALADRDGAGLQRLAATLSTPTSCHPVDLTDRAALASLVEAVAAEHGGIDVLICNAGLTVHGRFADLRPDQIDAVMEVDLRHVLHLTALTLPHLRAADGAHIVLVSSMAGLQAFPFQAVYSAAKHGLRAFGEALRWELASERIGVSTVLPGTIATNFLGVADSTDRDTSDRLAGIMQRWGTSPDRVATATVRAIRWNRGHVRVGWDCHLVAALQWLAPPLLPAVLARVARHKA